MIKGDNFLAVKTNILCRENCFQYWLIIFPMFQVRAAAVFALGTFVSSLASRERNDHARSIDQTIAVTLANNVTHDGSPLVRQVRLFYNLHMDVARYYSITLFCCNKTNNCYC